MTKFTTLVDSERRKQRLSKAELAQLAGISQSALTHIWKGDRNPGIFICNALALALGLPEDTLTTAAGLRSRQPSIDERADILYYRILSLPSEKQQMVEEFVQYLYNKHLVEHEVPRAAVELSESR